MSSFRDLVKKVNEEDETKKKKGEKTSSSFADLVRGVNDGSIKVDSRLDSSAVDKWYKSTADICKRASDYLGLEGFKTPNEDFFNEINSQLESSRDVAQYLRANKSNIKDYDKAYESHVEMVNTLRDLSERL